jgi:hypothetical protein
MRVAWVEERNDLLIPPTPRVCCIDFKIKGLQIGMLEVVENKGTILRLETLSSAFGGG